MQLDENSHFVTCIDILGYKEVLRRDNKEEIERIASEFFNLIEMNSNWTSNFPGFKYVTYTDNFLFYYKIDYNSKYRRRHDFIRKAYGEDIKSTKERIMRVLYLHILNLSLSQFDLAANNIFIRGGLTIGGFNVDEKIISGSGLIDAHDLEEKAIYPRIILNKCVVREFISLLRPIPLLYDMKDDVIFIDFLFPRMIDDLDLEYIHNIKKNYINTEDLDYFVSDLTNIRNNILNAFQTNTNDRVLKKYEWLIEFFNYFCYLYRDIGLNELMIDNHLDINEYLKRFRPIHKMKWLL